MTAKAIGSFFASGARFPVWSGSTRLEVRFRPIQRKEAARLFHDARRFERQTRIHKNRQDGKLGRNGLLVLQALLFDFIDYTTGALFPSYAAIAERANISASSVYRGLAKLKAAGVLDWVRRCHWHSDGRLEQDSNAYHLHKPQSWRGYAGKGLAQPAPLGHEIGAPDAVPTAFQSAAAAAAAGDRRTAQSLLELEPPDTLAGRLAALNRARKNTAGEPRS